MIDDDYSDMRSVYQERYPYYTNYISWTHIKIDVPKRGTTPRMMDNDSSKSDECKSMEAQKLG